jgi:phospholipid transport system substrate-binding protein
MQTLSARCAMPTLRAVVLGVLAVAWLLSAFGQVEAGAPTETLRGIYGEANKILADPTLEDRPMARLASIRALFSRAFDFRGAAQRALGNQWQARTPAEQSEFTSLFAGFVQRGFVYWIASVAELDGNGGGVTINYLGESTDKDRALVHTGIASRAGRQVLLDHDMVYLGKHWMVRDVTIDGISLVANYRAQFDRVIRGSSYHNLVVRMQERVNEELPPSIVAGPERLNADILRLSTPQTR